VAGEGWPEKEYDHIGLSSPNLAERSHRDDCFSKTPYFPDGFDY
jgi:hypothetical protein